MHTPTGCKGKPIYPKTIILQRYFGFFKKKVATFVCSSKKSRTFAHAIERQRIANLGIWCNGNTTDSGPVILGSSPSIPT